MYRIAGVFGCVLFLCLAAILGFGAPSFMASESYWRGAPAPVMWASWVIAYTCCAFLVVMAGVFAVMAMEG